MPAVSTMRDAARSPSRVRSSPAAHVRATRQRGTAWRPGSGSDASEIVVRARATGPFDTRPGRTTVRRRRTSGTSAASRPPPGSGRASGAPPAPSRRASVSRAVRPVWARPSVPEPGGTSPRLSGGEADVCQPADTSADAHPRVRRWGTSVVRTDRVGTRLCGCPRSSRSTSALAADKPYAKVRLTGIDKRPVEGPVAVRAPGPRRGDSAALAGDYIGDERHHGGDRQAVYAFQREDLDRWERELGRPLPDGVVRREPHHAGHRPRRGAGGGALVGRRPRSTAAARAGGHRPADPVPDLRRVPGRARLGQAVHRRRRAAGPTWRSCVPGHGPGRRRDPPDLRAGPRRDHRAGCSARRRRSASCCRACSRPGTTWTPRPSASSSAARRSSSTTPEPSAGRAGAGRACAARAPF